MVSDSPGFFLTEKIEVLLDNKAVRSQLISRILGALDHEITTDFNRVYTSVGKPVKVR